MKVKEKSEKVECLKKKPLDPEETMKQANKKISQHLNTSALLFVAKHSYKSSPIISCCCYQMNSRSSGLSIN